MKRLRLLYLLAMLAVIASGLWWRSAANPVPPFWHKYGGDALWALLIFFGMRWLLLRAAILRVTLLALAFCFAVELSQLYHAPWIDSLRRTRLGALTLGSTFNAPDFVAYAVGIVIGSAAEIFLTHRRASKVYPPLPDSAAKLIH